MQYTALYRKFRPQKFEDIVGQEHITKTLKNQIIAGRVGHAYLFNGGRGTGKTSAAKVLARAINCLNPQNGEPCNECEICKAALSGALTDIVEMDAASNNSVEDIRLIRDEVNFLPTLAKYRVYIIDEVHMLSTGAFNALLKTLEEPPPHVKFILATTEPQKLPATILSRCQRFDFKKISNENIEKRLNYICNECKIEITEDALRMIAVLAEGAMRDALSILERCIQDGTEQINEDRVRELVGIPKLIYINKVVSSIINNDVENALETTNEVINDGKDTNNFIWEIIKYVKDILMYKTVGKLELYNNIEIEDIKKLSDNIDKQRLLEIIYKLSELENDMKWSSQKTIMFQIGIIKLCSNISISSNRTNNNIDNTKVQELVGRVGRIENEIRRIENGLSTNVAQNVNNIFQNTSKKENKIENIQPAKIIPKTECKNAKKMQGWNKVLNNLKQDGKLLLYTNLINTVAYELNDMTIGIEFTGGLNPFGKTVLEKSENVADITKLVSMECGKPMQIRYITENMESILASNVNNQKSIAENTAESLGLPLNIIE